MKNYFSLLKYLLYLAVKFDCSDPVLSHEAVDMVDRMLPDARVPRFSKSPVLRCFLILRPYGINKI